MRRLIPAPERLALHCVASSRAIEAHAQARLPTHTLMARAGLAVAKLALAIAPHARRIWVACGPGNNGGDGLVAARWLHAQGYAVQVSLIGAAEGSSPPADAAWALQQARAAGVPVTAELPGFQPDLIIDALLGLGSSRAPQGTMASWIAWTNSQRAPVLAVDLPTGLASDTGALLGPDVVRASHTLALLSAKPGLFTSHGREQCGELWLDDLDVVPDSAADAWLLGHACLLALQEGSPSHAAHKGSQGDVLVLGGATGMQGAARLAARSALAAGAGRVYAGLLDAQAGPDPQRAELMLWPLERLADAALWRGHCVVAGCGGGAAIAAHLPLLLQQAQRLVLDADGLNAVAADAALRSLLQVRQTAGLATVLTPHPLEAARLLDSTSAAVQTDRLAAAQALCRRYDCTVLLKGSGSVIASPGETPAINSSGNAALATAGTGDVLAGWLGGLWAQQPAMTPHQLACAGAYWHGLAGETQAHGPLRAGDLIERMHALHARKGR